MAGSFTNMALLGVIISFFYVSGLFVPMVIDDLNSSGSTVYSGGIDVKAVDEGIELSKQPNLSAFNVFGVVINVFKLVWVGAIDGLPIWLDVFYTLAGLMSILILSAVFIPTVGGGA